MDLKKFIAPTMREALLKVKDELGPQAVIIRTEQLSGGVLNAGQIEVTASLDESLIARPEMNTFEARLKQNINAQNRATQNIDDTASPFQGTYTPGGQKFQPQELPHVEKIPPSTSNSNTSTHNSDNFDNSDNSGTSNASRAKQSAQDAINQKNLTSEFDKLQKEMKKLQSQISEGFEQSSSAVPAELRRVYRQLTHSGIIPELAGQLITEYALEISPKDRSEEDSKVWIKNKLTSKLPIAPTLSLQENRATILLFLGPTGVGKSTTIAKIAAEQLMSGNVNVGIISTDGYRMGAMEQMSVFARSAQIDFRAAFSEEDIDQALDDLKDKDLILVDSAGRSREHKHHMSELSDISKFVQADETYLVLAANTRERDLNAFYEKFKPFGISRLIYTKVDETSEMGALWNLSVQKKLGLAYLCHGQTIPDDILTADASEIAGWIMAEG